MMTMRRMLMGAALAAGLASGALAQAPAGGGGPAPLAATLPQAQTTGRLQVDSATFASGRIPLPNSAYGANTSPQLSWKGGPPATRSYVLIAEDASSSRAGAPILHWLAFDIPAATTSLAEGLAVPPEGLKQGANVAGQPHYRGPHPPSGEHVYHFQVFALDRLLGLPEGASRDQVLAGMAGHVLAEGEAVGAFAAPASPAPPSG